jgi:hypothetical protein
MNRIQKNFIDPDYQPDDKGNLHDTLYASLSGNDRDSIDTFAEAKIQCFS